MLMQRHAVPKPRPIRSPYWSTPTSCSLFAFVALLAMYLALLAMYLALLVIYRIEHSFGMGLSRVIYFLLFF
jgi:hypothetical protein